MQNSKNVWNNEELIKTIKNGGTAVIPTDTVYGFVVSALSKEGVEKLYKIRKPSSQKPCIILISNEEDIKYFGIDLSVNQKEEIKKYWPGPVSIILDCEEDKFENLHKGTKTLSFRLPDSQDFREFLKQTGPLLAPSANTEGNPISKNIEEAKKYFGDKVDFYLNYGEITGKASKIIRLYKDGSVSIIRE